MMNQDIVINESSQQMKDLTMRYLKELEKCDVRAICELFDVNAEIHSPFLGCMKPKPFFDKLKESSGPSTITPIDIFLSSNDSRSVIAYFQYDWTLSDGTVAPFNCVDIFEFNAKGLIEKLVIIYDTFPIRDTVGDKYSH